MSSKKLTIAKSDVSEYMRLFVCLCVCLFVCVLLCVFVYLYIYIYMCVCVCVCVVIFQEERDGRGYSNMKKYCFL